MLAFLIVSGLVWFLNAGLFQKETFDQVAASNGADCEQLSVEQCPLVGSCVIGSDGNCTTDVCFKRKIPLIACGTATDGTVCAEVPDTSFCVSNSRLPSFTTVAQKCTLEWGEFETAERGLCAVMSGCGPVTPIPITGNTYYVCGPGTVPRDPCSGLKEDSCLYVGDCMLIDGVCVTDGCFERTYTHVDGCVNDTCDKTTFYTSTPEQGYCKTKGQTLHHWCNVISSSGIGASAALAIKKQATPGASAACTKTVTIENYDGDDTLLIANNDADLTFTAVYDAALSLRSFVVSILVMILLSFVM